VNIVSADWLPYRLALKRPWQSSQGSLTERQRVTLAALLTEKARAARAQALREA